jgi:hypothetical protein
MLASELLAQQKDEQEYDLDLTRFNTDEKTEIRTEYFEKMSYLMRPNCLKKITLDNI